jgi:CO/xanthine dehydrogenase Mo-binding subunit
MTPTLPTIIAISRAIGWRIREVPATPERVLSAIHARSKEATSL